MTHLGENVKEAFFPLGADPQTHISRVPFASYLGLRWEGRRGDTACVRMMPSSGVSERSGQTIDPLAVLSMIDHVCSASVYLALPAPSLIATIDLRVEFAIASIPSQAIVCEATTNFIDSNFAFVRAIAKIEETGEVIAYASSTYAVGSHPGMAGKSVQESAWLNSGKVAQQASTFLETIGLPSVGNGVLELQFAPHLIGAVTLPALHGGAGASAVVLGAIELAKQSVLPARSWRVLSVTISFLRAVRASDLHIRASLRKTGKKSCVVSVEAHQEDVGKQHIRAECILVPVEL